MERTCPCGALIESASPIAKFCSGRCRTRAYRAKMVAGRPVPEPDNVRQLPRKVPATPEPAQSSPVARDDGAALGSVVGRVIAELQAAGALDTAAGMLAVKLAQLIDQADVFGGASAAGWGREMRAALAEATAKAPADAEDDPIERRARRRAQRGA